MTEWIILMAFVMVGTGAAVALFLDNVGDFYNQMTRVISLPFP